PHFGRGLDLGEDEEDPKNPMYRNKMPWDARFTYVATYNNNNRQGEITNHSLMFTGNIHLSPNWEVGFNSGYDLKNKGVADTRLNCQRHPSSYRLSLDWTPFGGYGRWYLFTGIKSSILQDHKWESRSQPPGRRYNCEYLIPLKPYVTPGMKTITSTPKAPAP